MTCYMSDRQLTSDFNLRDYVLVLLRRKWVVIGCSVAFGVLAFAYTQFKTPVYSSTAKIAIQRVTPTNLLEPSLQRTNPDLVAEIELQSYDSDKVKKAAQDKLGYKAEASASASGRGSVMSVVATDPDPQKAADIANRYAESFIEVRRQLNIDDYIATAEATQARIDEVDKQLAELDAASVSTATTVAPFPGARASSTTEPAGPASERARRESLTNDKEILEKNLSQLQVGQGNVNASGPQIISPAKVSSSPVSPNVKRDTLLGFIVGLILGVAGAFLLDFLDDSIRSSEDLEASTERAPMLAMIPYHADWRNRSEAHLVSVERPSSPTAEAYRTLRTAVQFAGLEKPIKALQITSPRAQDGKTTSSTNLAVALARAGMRVVLVDCDLRRPRVHEFLGASNEIGFTSVLLGEVTIEQAMQKIPEVPYLRFLASGPVPPNPSELLAGRRAGELFETLKAAADIVVVDTPPVLPVSDALVVSDLMDAVIMVVTAGSTKRSEARRSFELLSQVEAPIVGTVMNRGSSQHGYGYGYGYGYGHSYGSGKRSGGRATGAMSRLARSVGADGGSNGSGASTSGTGSRVEAEQVPERERV